MSIRAQFWKALAVTVAVGAALSSSSRPLAQAGRPGAPPSSVLPTGGGKALLDVSDTVFLLLDHQAGLLQTVKDIDIDDLRRNTIMLAKLATLLKIPVITTASEPGGPNGPLMPEIHEFAPHAVYVPRKGEVNAWDNEDFVRTVNGTGRKTLHPSTTFQLSTSLSLRTEVFGFWRQRITDGLYSQPGFLLRSGQLSDAKFVGTLGQSELAWPRAASSRRRRMRSCPRHIGRGTVLKPPSSRSCTASYRRTTQP